MDKRITHAALAALVLAMPLAGPASAQVGPDANVYRYGESGPGRYEYAPRPRHRLPPPPADDDWNMPPPPPPPPPPYGAYDRPRYRDPDARRRWDDGSCITSRGTCPAPARPPGASCGCEIPGFGYKRGQIGD